MALDLFAVNEFVAGFGTAVTVFAWTCCRNACNTCEGNMQNDSCVDHSQHALPVFAKHPRYGNVHHSLFHNHSDISQGPLIHKDHDDSKKSIDLLRIVRLKRGCARRTLKHNFAVGMVAAPTAHGDPSPVFAFLTTGCIRVRLAEAHQSPSLFFYS